MLTFHIAPWVLPILGSALMLGIYDISKKQAVKDNSVLPVLFWATTIGSIFFLLLTWLLHGWGLLLGMAIMAVILVTTRTAVGGHYLYPVFPFNGTALMRLLFRQPISRHNAE